MGVRGAYRRVVLAALWPVLLAGCNATYTADVVNTSDRSISARLLQDRVTDDPRVLASERIGPGQSATLGPAEAVVTDGVSIAIEDLTEPGLPPQRLRLDPGRTTITISPAGERTVGSVAVSKSR